MSDPVDPEVVHQFEHETWSRCAEGYLDHFAGLTGATATFVAKAANVGPGKSVLDVGSGPGHVAGALARAGADVIGVDFSRAMIEVARRHHPQARFQEADAEQLPFEEASFDAVISNFVPHHLARPDVVFQEIWRVLRPGGRFAFAVFAEPEAQSSIGAFFEAVAAHHDLEELPHGPLFGAGESAYEPLLRAAGFAQSRFEVRDITWRTDRIEPVLQAFLEWGNIAAFPDEVGKKIEHSARENLQRFQEGEGFAYPHAALLGVAEKS